MLDTPTVGNGRPTGMMSYEPLSYPQIQPDHIEIWNAFYKLRNWPSVLILEKMLKIQPRWQKTYPELQDSWIVSLSIDQQPAELIVPASLLNGLVENLDPDLKLENLARGQRAIIVEFALTDSLTALENWLRCSISLVMLDKPDERDHGHFEAECVFAVELDSASEVYCVLKIGVGHLQKLVKGLDSLPQPYPIDAIFMHVPVEVNLRWASIDLTYQELRSLGAGDIIFLDRYCHEAETAILVIGDRWAARVKVAPDGYELLEEPGPISESGLDWCTAEIPRRRRSSGLVSNNLTFRAFVELAQFQIPYDTFAMLQAGSQLPATQDRDMHLDFIVNGTRICSGELTMLGDGIGFQILRI